MRLRAIARLQNPIEDAVEVEAQFDKTREPHLKQVQSAMYKARLVFTYSQHHLYHKTNLKDVEAEIALVIRELESIGYKLHSLPGATAKPRFALKGKDGIVFQRIDNIFRIFFYTP